MLNEVQLFDLAQQYRQIGDYQRAFLLYREIIKLYPQSEQVIYSRVQLASHSGKCNFRNGLILLPFPLDAETREFGGLEMLSLGAKRYNVNIPQGIRLGQKIRMRNVAHHIDPVLSGDIHLLVSANDKPIYRVKRDVLLDLPIDIRGLTSDVLKRVTIEGKLFDVKIPGDATSGTRITLKNRAVITNGGYPGDIIIRVVNMSRRSWSWSGIFEQFGSYGPSKFSVKFTLPWLFEIGGEWDFKKSFTEVHMGK